jgi:integrase
MSQKTARVPGYRRHSSGQARVTLDGKDHLLGPYGSDESRAEYRRLVAEWLERRGAFAPQAGGPAPLSVNELTAAYWKHAEAYYRFDGKKGTQFNIKSALGVLARLYGHTSAADFGPLALKACRAEMVRKDWSRTYVNAQVDRVRRVFAWAVAEELLPDPVYSALLRVPALRKGHTEAREKPKVRPVSPERVEATLSHLPPAVRALVLFERWTGCRPDEACRLRPMDVFTDSQDAPSPIDLPPGATPRPDCWVYVPGSDRGAQGDHKTAHHGHSRLVLIGPQAQEYLRPFLSGSPDAYCFSPIASERLRAQARRAGRKSPLTPSQQARRAKAGRKRAPRDRYDATSYRNAVWRACDRAHPLPEHLAPRMLEGGRRESLSAWRARLTTEERAEVRAWRKRHRWHPNQLRHLRATELRPHGLDLTSTILGHSKVETSLVYAEKNLRAAIDATARLG